MSAALDYVRQQEPFFKTVDDDTLTAYLATQQPAFLDLDPDLKERWQTISRKAILGPEQPFGKQIDLNPADTSALEAQRGQEAIDTPDAAPGSPEDLLRRFRGTKVGRALIGDEVPNTEGPGSDFEKNGLIPTLASIPGRVAGTAGEFSQAALGDLAATLRNDNSREGDFSGNLQAAVHREELPVKKALELSAQQDKDEHTLGWQTLAGDISLGLADMAPKVAMLEGAPGAGLAKAGSAAAIFGGDAKGNFSPGNAAFAAAFPYVTSGTAKVVDSAIAKAVERGFEWAGSPTAQKAIHVAANQAAMNALMAAQSSPELMDLADSDPEEFKRQIAKIVGSNLAFAIPEALKKFEPVNKVGVDVNKTSPDVNNLSPGVNAPAQPNLEKAMADLQPEASGRSIEVNPPADRYQEIENEIDRTGPKKVLSTQEALADLPGVIDDLRQALLKNQVGKPAEASADQVEPESGTIVPAESAAKPTGQPEGVRGAPPLEVNADLIEEMRRAGAIGPTEWDNYAARLAPDAKTDEERNAAIAGAYNQEAGLLGNMAAKIESFSRVVGSARFTDVPADVRGIEDELVPAAIERELAGRGTGEGSLTSGAQSETTESAAPETETGGTRSEAETPLPATPTQKGVPPAMESGTIPVDTGESPVRSAARSRTRAITGDRRPADLIDHVEGWIGTIDPTLIKQANPDWKPVGAARKIFKKGGTPADVAADTLAREGVYRGDPNQPDQLGDLLNQAAQGRKGARRRAAVENRQIRQDEAFARDRSRPGPNQRVVVSDDLQVGDTLKIRGESFKVRDLEFDDDGQVIGVTLDDGAKYGTQQVNGGVELQVDKRSLRHNDVPLVTGRTAEGTNRTRLARPGERGELVGRPGEWPGQDAAATAEPEKTGDTVQAGSFEDFKREMAGYGYDVEMKRRTDPDFIGSPFKFSELGTGRVVNFDELHSRAQDLAQSWANEFLPTEGAEGEVIPPVRKPGQSIGSGLKAAVDRNRAGEGGFVHLPKPDELLERFTDLPEKFRDLWAYGARGYAKLKALQKAGPNRDLVTYNKDAADNTAAVFGKQSANIIRHDLNRAFGAKNLKELNASDWKREAALTFVIETGEGAAAQRLGQQVLFGKEGPRAGLADFRKRILESENRGTIWARRALQAIAFAEEHWDKLAPIARDYARLTDAQNAAENAAGYQTLYRRGGYVFHLQDLSEADALPTAGGTQGPTGAAAPFRHIRDYQTYADSIAAGVKPQSLSAVDLLQRRMTLGRKLINYGSWFEGLRGIVDPTTEQPLATDVDVRIRADGTQDVTAPIGYTGMTFGGRQLAIHNGYKGLLYALTKDSVFNDNWLGQTALQLNTFAKHSVLLGDSFHMGRLAFWNGDSRMRPPTYLKGVTLLDNTRGEIQEMITRGEVPEEWGKDYLQAKVHIEGLLANGLNLGGVGDNLHAEFVQKIPGFGNFNKWLFEQYQRGAMVEVALMEFARQKELNPDLGTEPLYRKTARAVNTRFGNLGSQGWIKSKTFQDLARLLFLAPQWNESLIRAELGAVREVVGAGVNVIRNPGEAFDHLAHGRLPMGFLAKGVGTAVLGQFLMNQVINYYTRGYPTWKNPEEEAGAKLSAWIPDKIGGGPGFFLNPLAVPMEITHLLWKATDRSGGDFTKALAQFMFGRLSNAGRVAQVFVTRSDAFGRRLRGGTEVAKEMASAALPLPISSSAVYRAAKQAVTGEHEEAFPGQFEKQVLQSAGIKTDPAPSPEQRIGALASRFNRAKGIQPNPDYYIKDFDELTQALRRGNNRDAQSALADLLQKKTPEQVYRHYSTWATYPFTGNKGREAEFFHGLDQEQQATYQKAKTDRQAIGRQAAALLRNSLQGAAK